MSAPSTPPPRGKSGIDDASLIGSWARVLAVWLVLALVIAAIHYLPSDLRAYAVLVRFADPDARGPLLWLETHAVTWEEVSIPTADGPLRARLYMPKGVKHPKGMVAVHGIHHLGMDEPRLISFAKALAGSGIAVLTPQIDSLADYHVDAASIADIGESAVWLDDRLGNHKVTVTGISFAGGLSLLAASDPKYASHVRALVLMGAYDDLARVSRFLATGVQELPDGTMEPHPAHDYGAAVFVYAHLNQFFPAGDLAAAHDALRAWLWEHPEDAKPFIEKLSPASQGIMDALLARRIDEVRPQILNAIHTDEVELAAISPHGQIDRLRVPVFILHGSADNIIPPAESLWLAKDIPRAEVREVLITGAFSHVDPEKHPPLLEELKLVRFVGAVLRAAN
jgi:pimeloyl-ACP methyl ester carboxylesterase